MADFTIGPYTERRSLATLRHDPASATRHLDWVLLATVTAISGVGLVMIYSATRGALPPYDPAYLQRQVMFLVIGGLVMAATALVDYRKIRDYAPFLYGTGLVLLALVLTPVGTEINGSQGWFVLGPFQLQPSEIAKLALVLALAALASQFGGEIDLRRLGALLLLTAVPMGLVMLEPDLGQSLVIGCILFALLIVAGVKPRHLLLLAVVLAAGVFAMVETGTLDQYQRDRLTAFAQQEDTQSARNLQYNRGVAYNLNQAKSAIGSGGVTGKGLFEGPLTKLGSVPEQRTDFIFTALGEQWGFAGAGTLLALYSVLIWRIWRTAQLARDHFGTLLCAGVLGMFLFQIFQNAGMTMGIMPITGITLPFMSYGGSSLLVGFAAIGLVLNVHMRRFS